MGTPNVPVIMDALLGWSFLFLGWTPSPPPWFHLLGISEAANQQARDSLRFASPRKILGLAFSFLACSGVGVSSGWFRGALHFEEKKGEDQQLHPAVPCQGHPPAADSSSQFLLQSCSAPLPPLPTLLSPCFLPSRSLCPRCPKKPNSSFSYAIDLHRTPTVCLVLV